MSDYNYMSAKVSTDKVAKESHGIPYVWARIVCPTPPETVAIDIPGLSSISATLQTTPHVKVSSLTSHQKDDLAAEWRRMLDLSDTEQESEVKYRARTMELRETDR